jgi:hypothetical protein
VSYQPVPAPRRPLSKGKKIAIGVAVLLAVPPFIAGAISGAKGSGHHNSTAAPAASHSRPASKAAKAPAAPSRKQAAHPTPGPAQKLADLDGNAQPVAAYQRALDALAPKCTQGRARIAAIGNATLQDLQENGITDETELSVLRHLNDSLPAGSPRTDCVSIAAAYATLRENG